MQFNSILSKNSTNYLEATLITETRIENNSETKLEKIAEECNLTETETQNLKQFYKIAKEIY